MILFLSLVTLKLDISLWNLTREEGWAPLSEVFKMQFRTVPAHLEFTKIFLLCKIYTEMAIKKQYSLTYLFQSQP